MDKDSAHDIMSKIIYALIGVWMIVFIPLLVMVIFLLSGQGGFMVDSVGSWTVLYYNILIFPIIILLSSVLSWYFLSKKKYGLALFAALFPFVNVLIELVVIDIALVLM